MSAEATNGFEQRLQQRVAVTRNPLETIPTHSISHGNIPNTPLSASTISFLLGTLFSLGATMFLSGGFSNHWWATYQLGFFLAAWSAFHWGEFAVTAGWNLDKCSVDSFLLDNGAMYHVANTVAVSEYVFMLYIKPSSKSYPYVSTVGQSFTPNINSIVVVLVGQALRSIAMIHASSNFSHAVAFRKRDAHKLVTDGIYSLFRHPSYAGFFYWALGTQLVLQNTISLLGFAIVLWRFFYYRIRGEEKALISFFGKDYEEYRRTVSTKIPFIP
ncbi:Isoprenylcysteine carboxyl methyltransferase family-domain-containing protein [Hygrophoropsis aurantiaca]|uniref:Isoprenylcysteine carboxyl methyltransferase family-domain-containing protein n=1 Tax=Hygrophoropsis aurantiaca TaxID=72124 RepID=A0ACB8AL77_9AGAM|nr:Isoprenylcysteine carboxyl methyltransferase family-domain-containing protein [Hygrophoropsis aurantiaca]